MQRPGLPLSEIERVYRRSYTAFVRTAAAIAGDWRAGEDAVHDAFVIAVRGRRGFRGEGSPEGWLWTIVVNAAKARRRREQRPPLVDVAGSADSSDVCPRDEQVRELVHELPERQRLALFLRYYADLDYRTIAAVLDIREGTVGATLNAAHNALRTALLEVD